MPRVDLFTTIHKAVRALIFDVGQGLQQADLDDDTGTRILDRVEHALVLLEEHHDHEERSIFPHLRAFEPEMIAELESQHAEVRRLLGVTGEALAATRSAATKGRAEPGAELNRRFNELAAFFLTHLVHEEVTALPASQAHFADADLAAMQAEIVAGIPPDRYGEWMRWMLPALNRAELTGMFQDMKASAPPAALEGMKALAAGVLDPARWAAVSRAAGL